MQFNEVSGAQKQPAEDQHSTLSSFLKILSRRWNVIAGSIMTCLVLAWLLCLLMPKTYQASVYLAFNNDQSKAASDSSDPLADMSEIDEPPTAAAHVTLLGANELQTAFANQLGVPVSKAPEITVAPPQDDSLITVTAKAHKPQDAANYANGYVKLYFTQLLEKRNQQLQAELTSVNEQVILAQDSLAQVEDRQHDFEQRYGIAGLAQTRDSQLQNVNGVRIQQEQTDAALSASVARIASLKSQIAARPQYGTSVQNTSPDASIQNLQKQISALQTEDAGLSSQYPTTSYRRASILSQIASLQNELKALQSTPASQSLKPSDEYNRLETQLQEAQADRQSLYNQEDTLQREIAQQNGDADRLTTLLSQDAQISREVDQVSANVRVLSQKSDAIKLKMADSNLNIHVQDAAEPPIAPSNPNMFYSLILGLVLGGLLAWYQVVTLESKDDRIYSADEAASLIGAPVIASVPLLMDTQNNTPHEILPMSPATEFYRRLAATLTFAANGAGNASPAIVIGSAMHGEGRTLMISNLATVAGMDGRRVLVVDADTRNPSQHKRFNTPSEPGLTDYLLGREKLANVIHSTACKNVQVVPCGMVVPNPIQLLYSNRMAKFIDATRDLADIILYDVPACDGVIDPAIVASQVDGVLMVVGHETASRSKYIDAIELMEDAHARIIGVVSTDQGANHPSRRRTPIDLAANTTANRDLLAGEPLRLMNEGSDEAIVSGKWRKTLEDTSAAVPTPASPQMKESNFVFTPIAESNGNGHKSSPNGNGSASSGHSETAGTE